MRRGRFKRSSQHLNGEELRWEHRNVVGHPVRDVFRCGRRVVPRRDAVSIGVGSAERRYVAEPQDSATPERLFDRRWALALLDRAMAQLAQEFRNYGERGKHDVFDRLKVHIIAGDDGTPYSELADQLGMSEGATRVAAHRLRRRFGELLRREVARTVDTAEQVEEELRHLIQAVGRG